MTSDVCIQVALVEDHPLIQQAILNLLHTIADLHVCAIAGSAEEALQLPALVSADLILVDISLPKMNGIQLIRELLSLRPNLACVMLSLHTQLGYVAAALAAGARGYVTKGCANELPAAIRSVLAGNLYLSGSLGLALAGAAQERQASKSPPPRRRE